MMENKQFKFQGKRYYQQKRYCADTSCRHCFPDPGSERIGHGPYWFTFDYHTKKTKYVGRDLPPGVQAKYNMRNSLMYGYMLEDSIKEVKERIYNDQLILECLERFKAGDHLSEDDKHYLRLSGFSEAIL